MKIVSINTSQTATNERQISFNTDPPLTREIFDMYCMIVGRGNMFSLQNNLLTTNNVNIDPRYLTQAAESLTEAERQIEAAKIRAKQARSDFLKKVSERVGVPLGSADLPNSGPKE